MCTLAVITAAAVNCTSTRSHKRIFRCFFFFFTQNKSIYGYSKLCMGLSTLYALVWIGLFFVWLLRRLRHWIRFIILTIFRCAAILITRILTPWAYFTSMLSKERTWVIYILHNLWHWLAFNAARVNAKATYTDRPTDRVTRRKTS